MHLPTPPSTQEHLGYLGNRPVHAYDPAFHPHEAERVGFHHPGMISAPPRPLVCPATVKTPPWRVGRAGESEGGAGLVLNGRQDAGTGEGSYRLKKRFEAGSHGEVNRGAYFPLVLKPVGTMVVVNVSSCGVGHNGLLAVGERCGLNGLWDMVLKMQFLPSYVADAGSSQVRGLLWPSR